MSHARTINPDLMINIMVPSQSRTHILVSFPLNSYHPYERLGRHIRQDIYARGDHSFTYASKPEFDRVCVFHIPH